MKKIFAIAFAALCVSCSTYRLTGNYADTNHFFAETTLSYEEVWTRVIDYFALEGVPISTIDKSSGLIVSSKVSFLNHYTREVGGTALNPNAYVVIPTVRGGFLNVLTPVSIVGDWNIRIKDHNGRIIVNVNLINLDCYFNGSYGSLVRVPVASLGNFERGLIDYLTK